MLIPLAAGYLGFGIANFAIIVFKKNGRPAVGLTTTNDGCVLFLPKALGPLSAKHEQRLG